MPYKEEYMLYYSELLKRTFNTAAECEEAENQELTRLEKEQMEQEKKTAEKKTRAAEIESAYKEMQAAKEKYNKLVSEFIKDYKSFHFTFSNTNDFLNDVFDTHFRIF